SASDTASLSVFVINDAPALTPGAPVLPAITEDDTGHASQAVGLLVAGRIADADASALTGVAVIGQSPGSGSWQYSLDGGATWAAVGSVSDGSALLLRATDRVRYLPDGSGADSASLGFLAWDQTAGTAGQRVDSSVRGGSSAFSAASDSASVSVAAVNDAPVLVPWSPALPPLSEDDTASTGQSVAALLGGSVSDADAGALQGIALVEADAAAGSWQYSLDGGASWLALGSVAEDDALLLRPADRLRFVPDGLDATSATLRYRAWDQTAGSADSRADTGAAGGSSAFSSASDIAAVAVTAVNDAPVLTPAAPVLPPITEDAGLHAGLTVAALLGGSVSDVDAGALQGVAVTGLVPGNGRWQYSINHGASWVDMGAVSDNAALLLRATDVLRLVPDGIDADSAQITYRAWDQSTGVAGGTGDTSVNGGSTAFSVATDTAFLAITAVNDAPVLAAGTTALSPIDEDQLNPPGQTVASF
ncbi:hypothetical protein, partial [Aquincola tertiaricarbonis]|uniref:hypothetical protein n=1 Tax=Aquincola tertiaricarbonis TaxID=391953 RepID=UPI0006152DCD